MKCKCDGGGFLDCGDLWCVNGVLIDIDVANEGWQQDVIYPPAPCCACEVCGGSGDAVDGECASCLGTGWPGGVDESQDRLERWATTGGGDE